ncbi:hypothetical protein GCM10027080_24480 [Pedococcus soli]
MGTAWAGESARPETTALASAPEASTRVSRVRRGGDVRVELVRDGVMSVLRGRGAVSVAEGAPVTWEDGSGGEGGTGAMSARSDRTDDPPARATGAGRTLVG